MTVSLEQVNKRFGSTTVIDNLSATFRSGAISVLLGASGCGKTTTLRCIAGLETPDNGRIVISGLDAFWRAGGVALAPERRDIAMVFQSYALYPHMRVKDNLAFGLRRRSVPREEIERRVADVAGVLGLAGLLDRKPHALSGGQRQRVALARAIVNTPRALLLDEPLGALDLKLRQELQIELKHIQQHLGMTFVYVTHDQEEAMSVSDRIALMNAGRLEQVGVPADIYRKPASRFAAEFMGTTNLVEATKLGLAAPVWVSLRPEALRFAEEAPAGWQRVAGTIAHLEMLGPLTRLDVRLANGTILRAAILDAPQRVLAEGQAASLAFDATQLTVVP